MTQAAFLKLANSPWRMRLFLFWKLPAAWFMGINVALCDTQRAVVTLPFGWRAQNPFKSTYFAAQCAAGELSTGILALTHLQGKPPVSMLVTSVDSEYYKKASQMLRFTCEDGQAIADAIQSAIDTGQPVSIRAASVGTLPDGTVASRVWITWSFKKKS
jgi:Domain of unknown function (DUF4442)